MENTQLLVFSSFSGMIHPQTQEIESTIESSNRLLMGREHGLAFGNIRIVPQSLHQEDTCAVEIPHLY